MSVCDWRGYHRLVGQGSGATTVLWSDTCADCREELVDWPTSAQVQIEAIVALPGVTLGDPEDEA